MYGTPKETFFSFIHQIRNYNEKIRKENVPLGVPYIWDLSFSVITKIYDQRKVGINTILEWSYAK